MEYKNRLALALKIFAVSFAVGTAYSFVFRGVPDLPPTYVLEEASHNLELVDGASGGGHLSDPPAQSSSKKSKREPGPKGMDVARGDFGPEAKSGTGESTLGVGATECMVRTYRHKTEKDHNDREECSRHKNAFRLKDDPKLVGRASNSICVRVDGVPVKHEKIKGGLIIGSLPGPSSVVSVRYCLGKFKCSDNCKVPTDRFMEALGVAEPTDALLAGAANWDSDGVDVDVTANLDPELAGGNEVEMDEDYLYQNWIEVAQHPGCGPTVASAR